MMLSQGYHVPGGALQCQSWGDFDKAFLLEENILFEQIRFNTFLDYDFTYKPFYKIGR